MISLLTRHQRSFLGADCWSVISPDTRRHIAFEMRDLIGLQQVFLSIKEFGAITRRGLCRRIP